MLSGSGVHAASFLGSTLLTVLAAATFATTSQASQVARELSRADEAAIGQVLAPLQTEGQLSAYVGEGPTTCVEATMGRRICAWTITSRQAAWGKLAPLVPSNTSLTLLCELPLGDEPRDAGTCSVHENKSAKEIWEPAANEWAEETKGVKGGWFSGGAQRDARGERALELMEGARTALAISRLVGAAPVSCTGIGKVRTCLWKASRSVQGYPLLSDWLDTTKKIRLWCDLPEDGGRRAVTSCRGEVGD